MAEIIKGTVSLELIKQADENEEFTWQQLEGGTVRCIRPTENPLVKELRGGSVNGTGRIGTFEIDDEGYSWYSSARFDQGVGLLPMAMVGWGEFLCAYVNAITVPLEKE